ncbi:MAG: hypothetical protein V7672_06150 [Brevundimonas sp.]|uniref:hypothetical protein n=1 Tax=Brevundimonas sp. TaxID=1871086 RepID=UPI0030020E03
MAEQPKPLSTGKLCLMIGAMDLVIGLGFVAAGLNGMFGPDTMLPTVGGGAVALTGVGMLAYGGYKLSQADNRHGDLS